MIYTDYFNTGVYEVVVNPLKMFLNRLLISTGYKSPLEEQEIQRMATTSVKEFLEQFM